MYMNKFLLFTGILLTLAGCGGTKSGHWYGDYDESAVSMPQNVRDAYMQSASLYGSDDGGRNANIAVLLPMSGDAKATGNDIKTSVETAFLQKTKPNVKISFYDLSGDKMKRDSILHQIVDSNPDVIIGPLFAEDAKTLREIKPTRMPVLSFTSDILALGDGVMTMNLVPSQSIETITQQMQSDGAQNIVILAPNNTSGKLMASVAYQTTDLYNININGLFYYDSGNSDSIKDVAMRASLYNARNAANTRAREILSDILTKEKNLSADTRHSLHKQLEKLSRNETTGKLPYDAILFLGDGEDSKALISFLRYYGVGNRDVALYGTTLWQHSDIASDFALSGAKYATLPEISEDFDNMYTLVAGKKPDYLAAFGYDATNLALGMLYSGKSETAYLLDPSGYIGSNGVFRIQPSGESEHALRIMSLNGSGTPAVFKEAPTNFLKPLYSVHISKLTSVPEQPIATRGINPGDYITIPENLRKKSEYKTKPLGANYVLENQEITNTAEPIQIYASEEDETISNPEFEPVKLDHVSREYIDSVEVTE